jgi:hypothetical protein
VSGGASNSSGRQAYNAELIARIVDSPYLLVPTVVRELVTEEVLVL